MSAVQDYLEKLAQSHKEIQHDPTSHKRRRFYGPSKVQMEGKQQVVIYLHPTTGEIEHNGSQWVDEPALGFSVLFFNKSNSDEEKRTTLEKAQQIGLDILARMQHDKRQTGAACEEVLKYLDLKRVRYFDDGPHGDGYIGRAFVIPMRYAFENEYDATKWL